ncbi:MAG: CAP domain-containing protein [Candidatus Peribacteraceae bacterium]|nr:CAP domain-containing protein [Candidatus Peribacteraceae bacterium]MDD5742046.1 CAP domain-containing protein [Candidatus Peribacteraceae bacterium]
MSKQTALIALLCAFVTGASAQAPVVSRAEAVMFLFQMSQKPLPVVQGGQPIFSDVAAGSMQEQALQAAVENGMIGVNLVTRAVDPDASVSRGEYLRMLAILFSLPANPVHHYTDIPRTASYAQYAGIAERCNLFPLEKNTALKPEDPLLLSEAAGAVYTLFRCYSSLQPQAAATMMPSAAPASASPVPQTLTMRITSVLSPPLLPSPNATEQKKLQIIGLVNQERMAKGLLPLIRNPQLEQAAQAHAKDMYRRGYFSHFNPEGENYIDRIRRTQYLTLPPELCPCQAMFDLSELLNQRSEVSPHYLVTKRSPVCDCNPRFALGENIARGQQTAPIAVEQWMASPSHRQTILQSLFRETGVGVFGDVWVQEFGSLSLE